MERAPRWSERSRRQTLAVDSGAGGTGPESQRAQAATRMPGSGGVGSMKPTNAVPATRTAYAGTRPRKLAVHVRERSEAKHPASPAAAMPAS